MGYWLRDVSVPERLAGRDVFLVMESRGLTRIHVNGVLAVERMVPDGGSIKIPLAENLRRGDTFEVAVSIRHADLPWAEPIPPASNTRRFHHHAFADYV
jgi:hypothetical protein